MFGMSRYPTLFISAFCRNQFTRFFIFFRHLLQLNQIPSYPVNKIHASDFPAHAGSFQILYALFLFWGEKSGKIYRTLFFLSGRVPGQCFVCGQNGAGLSLWPFALHECFGTIFCCLCTERVPFLQAVCEYCQNLWAAHRAKTVEKRPNDSSPHTLIVSYGGDLLFL